MSAEQQGVEGRELEAGVPLSELAEGEPLPGQLHGEAVLLVRRGEEVWAVGATCTHYSGPLAEGLVVGDTVRCPWHRACFSLRTGEALAAPALNPLPRWRTRIEGGRVFLGEREEIDALSSRGRSAAGPRSVVIVGAGAAGSAAAEQLRREGYGGQVMLVDPDAEAPYDRPNLSKDYLAGNAPEEWLPLRPPGFLEERGIERVVDSVTEIVPAEGRVVLASGRALDYGALLLAPGATPVRLEIPGSDQPQVHVLRSWADCRRLIERASAVREAVVIGASFIGLEAAAALRARGVGVTVVAPEAVPFERTLGTELGAMLRALHEERGVRFRLGHVLKEIRQGDVVLDDDTVLAAGLVLLGVGVRPRLELAEGAGIATRDGIPVNEHLETAVRGVYAAGDVALYPDPRTGEPMRVEHWVAAQRQGQAAARNLLGRGERFTDIPFFWTSHYDVTVSYVGHARTWDEVAVSGDVWGRDCRVSYLRGGAVVAVATVNRDQESLAAETRLAQFATERPG